MGDPKEGDYQPKGKQKPLFLLLYLKLGTQNS